MTLENFTETERYVLPGFLNHLQSEDIKIDFSKLAHEDSDRQAFDISLTPHGKKFIKSAKKIDKHFNFHSFLNKVIIITLEQFAKEKEESNANQS